MSQETVTYLTNIVIATILACLMTHYWLRQGRSEAMRFWMLAAWLMTAADVFFAARPWLPHGVGRVVPTLLVTLGQATLLLGAGRTAERRLDLKLIAGAVLIHTASLIFFLQFSGFSDWRKVANGLIWAGLSFASHWALRKGPAPFWKPLVSPASVFLLHGIFHGVRVALAALFAVQQWTEASAWLQIVGDLEVSFFMVALFVGLLVSNLQMRNEELSGALNEIQTLTGLLPICSWCKSVRNDQGYWERVEDYLTTHTRLKFTHGICADCFKKHDPRQHKQG